MNNAKHTPERLAILRETWGFPVPIAEILRQLNDTPGHLPVTDKQAAAWAAQLGIRRGAGSRRASPPPETLAPGRESVLRHLSGRATGAWSYDRLRRLCDEWERGTSGDQIAAMLGVSKNAVVGKVHRLTKRGLLSHRPNPVRTGPRKGELPRATPVSRPMNVPPPSVTLPPLLSGLPPLLSTEPIYDGPPGSNFASRRPPRPVPLARWVADDGSWPTGPSRRPCQFVTQPGSVTEPWIFCGLPVSSGAWCAFHLRTVYHRRAA